MAKEKNTGERIRWHTAFFEAMKLELAQYGDALDFLSEYQLAVEPLKIDVVVIKKVPGITIEKNIARIFRHVNIVEYKSPEATVSVRDFHKVLGYAALYAALNREDMRKMTVTIVGTRHPRELFKFVGSNERFSVREESPGIYAATEWQCRW